MTEDRIMVANSVAWIVNWLCILLIFGGLVMLGKQQTRITELRNEQIKQLMGMIKNQDAIILKNYGLNQEQDASIKKADGGTSG